MRQRLSGQASTWDALVLDEGACATPFAHGVGWGDALCRGVKGVNGGNARWGLANWGQIPIFQGLENALLFTSHCQYGAD